MSHTTTDPSKQIARLVEYGRSFYVNVPRALVRGLCWNIGDVIKVEIQGGSLVMTRVPLEELGKARLAREVESGA